MARKGKGKKSAKPGKVKKQVQLIKKENGKSNRKDLRTIIVLSIIFIILLGIVLYYKFGYNVAHNGDKVSIRYTSTLENGTVIDTNIKEVAEAAGLYNPKRGYAAMRFTLGKGEAIKGVDEAVVGMRVGEEKTVIIPPEKAYGVYVENETIQLPISKEIPLTEKVTRDIIIYPADLVNVFNITTVKENDTLAATSKYKWPLKVIKISNTDLTARLLVNKGDYYEEGAFNYTVTQVSDTEMTVRRKPIYNTLPSTFGELLITEEKDKIVSRYNITVGARVYVDQILYYIVGEENNSMILDQNNFLAGKTLTYRIILENIG